MGGEVGIDMSTSNDPRTTISKMQREAQAAVKISHPNVCQVLDCGVDADGSLYIAMELLDGQSLGQRISDYAPLPLGEIADVTLGAEDYESDVHFNGQDATFMGIWVLPTAKAGTMAFPPRSTTSWTFFRNSYSVLSRSGWFLPE